MNRSEYFANAELKIGARVASPRIAPRHTAKPAPRAINWRALLLALPLLLLAAHAMAGV